MHADLIRRWQRSACIYVHSDNYPCIKWGLEIKFHLNEIFRKYGAHN